jgi:CubicO group peptidase (beta-lactamase class C family)
MRTDLDIWYDLASLTKPLVVTTIVLTALRRAELAPSTNVGEVLDELHSTPVSGISVGQLLTHTSGLPAWLPLYAMPSASSTTPVETLGRIDLEAKPGERVLYSCLDFVLLGFMIERASGSALDSLFFERVVAPLGLDQEIGFRPGDRPSIVVAGGAARATVEQRQTAELGFDPSVVPDWRPGLPDDGNARYLGGVAGNAGLFGTPLGVWSIARQYLPGGTLLSASEIELATRVSATSEGDIRGLGWQIASTPGCSAGSGLATSSFGHTGFTGTSVWVDPERNAVFVLLTNRHHPGHRGTNLHPLRRRFHALAAQEL